MPVHGHVRPWWPVVPPSLGARCRTPLRPGRKASPPPSSDNVLTAIIAGTQKRRGEGAAPVTDSQHYRRTKGASRSSQPCEAHRPAITAGLFCWLRFLPDSTPAMTGLRRQHRCQLRPATAGVLAVSHPVALLPASVACLPGGSFVALFPGR